MANSITIDFTSTDGWTVTDDAVGEVYGPYDTGAAATIAANELGNATYTSGASTQLANEKSASSASASSTATATQTPAPATTGSSVPNPSEPEDESQWGVVTPAQAADAQKVNGGAVPTFLGPYANPLDAYPDYTYNITLWMLSPDDYESLVLDPTGWTPSSLSGVIAASGGKYSTTGQYARLLPYFDLDFYFDELKFNMSIEPTTSGQGSTNNLGGHMVIIEPIGMTFIDRLTLATFNRFGGTLVEVPYMLEIDFFGAGKDGTTQSSSIANGALKKRFPITFSQVKMDFSSKGTTYTIDYLPYSHKALLDNVVSIKADAKVENVTTFSDFFGSANTADAQALNDDRADPAADSNYAQTSADLAALSSTEQKNQQQTYSNLTAAQSDYLTKVQKSTGLMNAINLWNYALWTSGAREYPDYFDFVIDDDIAKSPIVNPGTTSIQNSAMIPDDISTLINSASIIDRQGNTINVKAGTSIIELVNQMYRNSQFFQNQLALPTDTDSAKAAAADTPLTWIQVTPKVVPTQWDAKAGKYAKHVTYFVTKKTLYHTQHPAAAQTVPQGSPYKLYNYYFTGQNTSIIDCKLEFNCSYYQNVLVPNNFGTQLAPGSNSSDTKTANPAGSYPPLNGVVQNGIFLPVPTSQPRQINHIANDVQATSSAGGNRDQKTQTAASVISSIATSSGGDQLTLNLHIIGDPQYLKQDDTLWTPASKGYVDPNANPDLFIITTGALPFDGSDVYVDVLFKTEIDFDPATGLANPALQSSNPYSPPSFSGRFKVLMIDTTFKGGKFEQILHLSRFPDQEKREYEEQNSSSASRTDTTSGNTAPSTPSATATVTSNAANSTADAAAPPAADTSGDLTQTIGGP